MSILFSTVKNGFFFKSGFTNLEDDLRESLQKTPTIPQIIQQVHDMVLDDWLVKVRGTPEVLCISKGQVGNIFNEKLNMRMLCARQVPEKHSNPHLSSMFGSFQKNNMDFKLWFITVDKTWTHHCTPERKEQSKQWIDADEVHQKGQRGFFNMNKAIKYMFGIFS